MLCTQITLRTRRYIIIGDFTRPCIIIGDFSKAKTRFHRTYESFYLFVITKRNAQDNNLICPSSSYTKPREETFFIESTTSLLDPEAAIEKYIYTTIFI